MPSIKSAVLALGLVGACAEPVVEIVVTGTNPMGLDTSCVTAINTYVYGNTYETDKNDLKFDCKVIDGGKKTAAEVKDAFTGLFDMAIPDSGLYGVEIEAHTGGCPTTSSETPFGSDLIFNASARYNGSDRINLPLVPIASCETSTMKARAIDIFKLLSTKDCNQSILGDGIGAELYLGQLAPSLIDGTFYWSSGNLSQWSAGVGTGLGMPNTGGTACLSANIGTQDVYSISCVNFGPPVCALAGEVEVGVIPVNSVVASLDQSKRSKWGSIVVGSVWTGTGTARTPVMGATVEADPEHSEVVFVEPGPNNTLVTTAGAAATGASGLFVLFTDRVLEVKVKAARGERTLKLGADKRWPAVSLIQL
jgi:hypothetical protein